MNKIITTKIISVLVLVFSTLSLNAVMQGNENLEVINENVFALNNHQNDQVYNYKLVTASNTLSHDEIEEIVNEALRKVDHPLEGVDDRTFHFHFEFDAGKTDSPRMGVYTRNLTVSDLREMGYSKLYGVKITGIAPRSPARYFRLMPNDIIMEIDGVQIKDDNHLKNVIASYFVGDAVDLKIFRDGREINLDFTFGSRDTDFFTGDEDSEIRKVRKTVKLEDLAGGWIPVWFSPDLGDVNELISSFGFTELNSEGLFLNGGGGQMNIGKNVFIGGMGAAYSIDRKINHTLENEQGEFLKNVIRRMNFRTGYGGVTIDKKHGLTNRIHGSYGGMLGWGSYRLEVSQTDGDYNWTDLDNQLDHEFNNHLNLSRSFIFVQPKVTLSYQVTGWLAFRGEVGYLLGHSYHSGWNAELCTDKFEVKNSPDTSFNSFTFSLGPWFTL